MSSLTNAPLIHFAANAATALFILTILLQLLIAVGVLPVTMAWGGRQAALTTPLRVAGVAAVVLLGVFLTIIRWRAGLVGSAPVPGAVRIFAWVITAFLGINTLGNLASASRSEKIIFGPISFLLTAACFLVAASTI